jgi:hypothetical protein
VFGLDEERSERGEAGFDRCGRVLVDLGLAPVELEHAVGGHARVDAVGAVVVHPRIGLQVHLAENLRKFEEALGEEEQQHLTAFAGFCQIGKGAARLLDDSGDRLGAIVFGVARLGLGEFPTAKYDGFSR